MGPKKASHMVRCDPSCHPSIGVVFQRSIGVEHHASSMMIIHSRSMDGDLTERHLCVSFELR